MVQQIDLNELDEVLDRADALIQDDYAEAMRILGDVSVALPPPAVSDPFASLYAAWVLSTYRTIARLEDYEPSVHEADTNVQLDLPLEQYFPFSTKDIGFIGRYLSGVGMILSVLDLPPGSRVIEYGVGWGHVTAAMARSGHHVTCVDIEEKFLHLARRQAHALGCDVTTYHGAFGERPYPQNEPAADGVIFFEAFHHAFDHLEVLKQLRREVLRPGGVLVLAAEPVHPDFPTPWGIRPDGHALWAVRRHKWMELGFQEDYLLTALLREGFLVARTQIEHLGPFGLLYRCQLHEGVVQAGKMLLPSAEAASWGPRAPGDTTRLWAQIDSRATLDQDAKWVTLAVHLANHLPVPLDVTIDAGGGRSSYPTPLRRWRSHRIGLGAAGGGPSAKGLVGDCGPRAARDGQRHAQPRDRSGGVALLCRMRMPRTLD